MQDIVVIAVASAVVILALIVAWKLTWFLLKLILWLVALGALAGLVWWYLQPHPPTPVQQQVGSPSPPAVKSPNR